MRVLKTWRIFPLCSRSSLDIAPRRWSGEGAMGSCPALPGVGLFCYFGLTVSSLKNESTSGEDAGMFKMLSLSSFRP